MKDKPTLRWLMLFGAGLCLRMGISSVSPMLDSIQGDLSVASGTLGLLTAVPMICMDAHSQVGWALDRGVGLRRAMLAALTVLASGLVLRLSVRGAVCSWRQPPSLESATRSSVWFFPALSRISSAGMPPLQWAYTQPASFSMFTSLALMLVSLHVRSNYRLGKSGLA
jgi:hypothetical protein